MTNPTIEELVDPELFRSEFPALVGGYVYMDNAGGSQTCKAVADRVHDFLLNTNVQLGASYGKSVEATNRVALGQQAATALMGAADPCEVILGASTTQLLQNLAKALAHQFQPGDELIVTNCDHQANIEPWANLATSRNLKLKTWNVNQNTWSLELDDLKPLLTDRTKLVSFTQTSNVLGTIHPVKEYVQFIRTYCPGGRVCVDGVAYSPHGPMQVADWDVDFYSVSFYKCYGPHISAFYSKKQHLETLSNINHFFLEDELTYKLQPGNLNFELTYGLTGVLDYLVGLDKLDSSNAIASDKTGNESLGTNVALAKAFQLIANQERALQTKLLDFLNSKSNVRVIGRSDPDRSQRVPTISFVVDGMKSSSIVEQVDPHGIGIRFGHFYAYHLIESLGLHENDGVVRVSMVHYNTVEEVDRLIEVLDGAIEK